jgi:hypothetical protein
LKDTIRIWKLLLFCLFFLLNTQMIAFADTWSVNPDKNFTVKFSQPIDISNLEENIFIQDSKGNVLVSILEVKDDIVKIYAPLAGYAPGEYVIKISNNIKSKTNKKMKSDFSINFVVEDSGAIINKDGESNFKWLIGKDFYNMKEFGTYIIATDENKKVGIMVFRLFINQ